VQAQPVEYQRVALWAVASPDAAVKRMAMSVRFVLRQWTTHNLTNWTTWRAI